MMPDNKDLENLSLEELTTKFHRIFDGMVEAYPTGWFYVMRDSERAAIISKLMEEKSNDKS